MRVLGCSTESGLLGVAAGGENMYSPTAILPNAFNAERNTDQATPAAGSDALSCGVTVNPTEAAPDVAVF